MPIITTMGKLKSDAYRRKTVKKLNGNKGLGVVEIILLLIVLIALTLLFKPQITSFVTVVLEWFQSVE